MNTHVLQDLLSNDSAATIQITGSGSCSLHNASDGLCTDLTHFVLDYAAFEKLAHPGYGIMNLQMRSVGQLCLSSRIQTVCAQHARGCSGYSHSVQAVPDNSRQRCASHMPLASCKLHHHFHCCVLHPGVLPSAQCCANLHNPSSS